MIFHFKLNAIHGHATWQHHSPSTLTLKMEKRRCQIARFAGGSSISKFKNSQLLFSCFGQIGARIDLRNEEPGYASS